MKAEMLRNLQAADGVAAEPPAAATMRAAPNGAAPTVGSPPATRAAATCPEGTSPEEFEAYRRKCWEQYYEYTAACQKYYQQAATTQAKGRGKGPAPRAAPANPAALSMVPSLGGARPGAGAGQHPWAAQAAPAQLMPVGPRPGTGLVVQW